MQKETLWSKDFLFINISNFTAFLSYSLFVTVMALYVIDIGGTNRTTGLITAGLTLTTMACRPLVGRALDHCGRKPVFVIGGITFALNTVAYLFCCSLSSFAIVRVVHGISQALFIVAVQTTAGDIIPESRLVEGLGYFGISGSVAAALGPMTGLYIYEHFGVSRLFLCMSFFAVLGAMAAMLLHVKEKSAILRENKGIDNSESDLKSKNPLHELFEFSAVFPGLYVLLMSFAYSLVSTFLTPCGLERGIQSVSLYFTVCSFVMMATRLFSGKITLKIGLNRILSVGSVVMAGSIVLIAFAHNIGLLILSGVLYGVSAGLIQPVLQTLVFRLAPLKRRGSATATYGLMEDIGTGTGSAAWGSMTMSTGYTYSFLASAVVMALCGIEHLFILRPRIAKMKEPMYFEEEND